MILVYQMAKVASRSWVEQAQAAAAKNSEPTYHVHFATPRNLERIKAAMSVPPERQTIANMLMPRNMQRTGLEVCKEIEAARQKGVPIRVITGMRDPVARSISWLGFMADFYGHVSRPLNPRKPVAPEYMIDALQNLWQSVYENREPEDTFEWLAWFVTSSFRTWFDDELKAALGINVRASPFSAGLGAQQLSAPCVEALVYRVEDMTPTAPAHRALISSAERFLGTPLSELPNVNTSATRRTSTINAAVQQQLHLPQHLLDAIYDEPIVRHFYREEEIAAFKSRWSAR
jgi:hypothetical protein